VCEGGEVDFTQHRPRKRAGKGGSCGSGRSGPVGVHIVLGGKRDAAFLSENLGLSGAFKLAGNASRFRLARRARGAGDRSGRRHCWREYRLEGGCSVVKTSLCDRDSLYRFSSTSNPNRNWLCDGVDGLVLFLPYMAGVVLFPFVIGTLFAKVRGPKVQRKKAVVLRSGPSFILDDGQGL
jgi:hypothetical protein